MKKYLVIYHDNWADEMDVEGFRLFTQDELDDYVSLHVKYFETNSSWKFGVGSNEQIEYNDWEGIRSALTVKEITDAEYEMLGKLFPLPFDSLIYCNFGYFPFIEDAIPEEYLPDVE
jgi:hypothetical protein